MKKEVVLAIAIGFGLGLIITFGIWTANKSLKQAQVAQPSPTPISEISITPTSAPPTSTSSMLSISSPANELLTEKKTLTISGKSTPSTTVVILAETDDQIITTDTNGNFSTSVDLESGYNLITITSFDASGNSDTQNLTVTYTTAKV